MNEVSLTKIIIGLLQASPTQPRKHFSEEKHRELVDSVREHGIIQPLVVRKIDKNNFEIVIGERRTRAAREVGLPDVPCVVRELSDTEVIELQLIENLHREDLTP